MNANLFSRLFDGLKNPDKLAIETADGGRVTYGDLIAQSGRIADYLVSRGVKTGDRVAVQAEKSVPALVLYLAAVRAGAVYLPLNTAYTLNELDYFITDAEPSLIVCDPSKASGIAAIAAKVKANVDTLDSVGKGSLTEGMRSFTRGSDVLVARMERSAIRG
jgi:malonyl-CoA/methylmalonyl-CoA synthetase